MQTHGKTLRAEVTPTLQILGAYVAGDAMGGLLEFALGGAGGGGVIREIRIYDKDNEKAACKLYLFDGTAAPTAVDDADPFAAGLTEADLKNLLFSEDLPYVAFAAADFMTFTVTGGATAAVAGHDGLGIDYQAPSGKIRGYLVPDATPTYTAANDLTVVITAWAN